MKNLIQKLEVGPEGRQERELDCEIHCLINGFEFITVAGSCFGYRDNGQPLSSHINEVPFYTTSIDAALTLLGEGWKWGITSDDAAYVFTRNKTKTFELIFEHPVNTSPALALCIAILKARSHDNL